MRAVCAAVLTTAALAVGCGGGPSMVPVTGTITFDGGPPPAAGRVTFTPTETYGDRPSRPGMGRFDTDGEFVVTSFQEGDGLAPGRYTVKVSCLSGLPDVTQRDASASVSYVKPGYRPDPLVVETESGPIELNLDVPKNNPSAR